MNVRFSKHLMPKSSVKQVFLINPSHMLGTLIAMVLDLILMRRSDWFWRWATFVAKSTLLAVVFYMLLIFTILTWRLIMNEWQ